MITLVGCKRSHITLNPSQNSIRDAFALTLPFVHTNNMFLDCKNFNCDLSKWKLKNILDMSGMFDGCTLLKNKPRWYKK